mmetsp:Transcript_49349/g.150152  ORF Transcript_49349/g.150152 Transcript_49349/m.150152 type:complete len:211 (+) Transcript_49349:370-1002(+)
MPAHLGIAATRHRHLAGQRCPHALEGPKHNEPEGEGVPIGEASFHVLKRVWHLRVLLRCVLCRHVVALSGRLGCELFLVVRPQFLGADALCVHRFDAILDVSPRVLFGAALDVTLVVVDEQARRRKQTGALLDHLEVEAGAERVGGATPQGALVVDREVLLWPQVDFARQVHLHVRGERKEPVPGVSGRLPPCQLPGRLPAARQLAASKP